MVPPKGAPNVLLIMTDDQGYGVSGTFGGVIPTPTMDRIAKAGLRYTQFHSTALCSPTRAALITGRNHHSVGFGVIGEMSTGYPGLRLGHRPGERHDRNHSSRQRIRHFVVRQEPQHAHVSVQRGRALRSVAGRHGIPVLLRVHGRRDRPVDAVPVPEHDARSSRGSASPATTSPPIMADEAIKYMSSLNAAAPDKPFFVYYVPGGTHSPHQPKKEWIDKFKGKFDMGWEKLREQIFANQKRLGVIPANTQLTPWPDDLPKWDSLSLVQKKLYAREAEVFAGYAAYTDHEIGRVIQAVEDMGKLDNTLIIYISGDNGTSAEGTLEGTLEPDDRLQRHSESPRSRADAALRRLGLGQDLPAHVGGVVVGVRYAVQMDQAGGLALRRHPAGHGHLVARPHQGRRRHPHAVPSHDRHRADDPRSHGHPGAGHGRRHRAKAHRRREHGLHVRQGERQRAVEARHAVFRDVRQSRHLSRRLVRLHDAARAALGSWERPSCPTSTTTSGSSTTSPRTSRNTTTSPRRIPTS